MRAMFGADAHINGGNVYVGVTGSSGDWVEIDSSGIDINRNNVSVAQFLDSSLRLGTLASEHSTIDSSGLVASQMTITEDNADNKAYLNFTGSYTGNQAIKANQKLVYRFTERVTKKLSINRFMDYEIPEFIIK